MNKIKEIGKKCFGGIVFLALVFGINACKNKTEENITIEQQVANDSVTEYNMVKRSGQPVEVCVSAMGVVAAYLQAKDEPNYQKWQSIKNQDCQRAGM